MTQLPYGRHHINEADIAAVDDVLRGDWLTQGPKVVEFENALAGVVGARHAVAMSSGTAALHAAYFAAGLGPGQELVTTPITFAATVNAGVFLGARVKLVDIDPQTGLLDVNRLRDACTRRTKVIAPVHLAGQPVDLATIREIALKIDARVVDDAAHALGAQYRDEVGTWVNVGSCRHTDLSVFSFHPVKHITTGEGGAVTTNDDVLAERLKLFRTHGITRNPQVMEFSPEGPWMYDMVELGHNYRVTDFQCALGLSQLSRLDEFVSRRREIASRYDEAFRDVRGLEPLLQRQGARSSYHLYVIRLELEILTEDRAGVFDRLRAEGLGVNVHYIPVPRLSYYRRKGFRAGDYPNAEEYYRRAITLPLYPSMTDSDIRRVVDTVLAAISAVRAP